MAEIRIFQHPAKWEVHGIPGKNRPAGPQLHRHPRPHPGPIRAMKDFRSFPGWGYPRHQGKLDGTPGRRDEHERGEVRDVRNLSGWSKKERK